LAAVELHAAKTTAAKAIEATGSILRGVMTKVLQRIGRNSSHLVPG
jgi:hypothetical protein